MSNRQLLLTVLLTALAEILLLGVVVFLAEPRRVGGPAPHFQPVDVAYLAVPFLLMAAALLAPLRALHRHRRREEV